MRNRALSSSSENHTLRARALRRDLTRPEKILWAHLRGRKVHGLKFRRQEPVGPYVVDFLCAAARLVVEIDGDSHEDSLDYDLRREGFLRGLGYAVLRFRFDDVMTSAEVVVERIAAHCARADAPTQPPPEGEENPRGTSILMPPVGEGPAGDRGGSVSPPSERGGGRGSA